MDLTKDFPRSAKDKIAGVVMLARTADKAKAKAHGNIGEYHYDCPMDKAVFGFLNIDQAQFLETVTNAKSDADIESFAKPFVQKKSAEEITQFNEGFLKYAPEPGSDGEKFFLGLRSQIAPDRTDITAWPDLLDIDEKRSVPKRETAKV